MKLLIKEYLSSLKERGELDAILPDLLSEMGLHVYSRPAVGVRQHGVDLAAVGTDSDGVKKVFLLTVKSGNLTRNDWDGTIQAVRPSLNEILDSYIPNRIPKQHKNLPVAICVCVGGDIDQNVDSDLTNFENRSAEQGIEFQRWDGDQIANMLMSAILGERLLPSEAQSSFRKAVAMLDEPSASYDYFSEMILVLQTNLGKRQKDIVTFVRQLNLCVWVLFVWSREAENLEAPYRCSELAMLWCWKLTSPYAGKSSATAKSMAFAMHNITQLHLTIANDIIAEKYLPHAEIRDGLSTSVKSSFALDVNLKLFEMLGRIALTGIWFSFFFGINKSKSKEESLEIEKELNRYTNGLISILNNNGALRNPITDTHSIEVNLVCIFLAMQGRHDAARDWTGQVLPACLFAINANSAYPTVASDYQTLAEHPKPRSDDDYFKSATSGSTLFPTLVAWQKIMDNSATFGEVAKFFAEELSHCTLQLWVTDETSEEHLYTNSDIHGLAVVGISITEDGEELMEIIKEECRESNSVFNDLSAMRLGNWPILLAACRHHRTYVPVNFWRNFFESQMPSNNSYS